jgi:hypothetical protein
MNIVLCPNARFHERQNGKDGLTYPKAASVIRVTIKAGN